MWLFVFNFGQNLNRRQQQTSHSTNRFQSHFATIWVQIPLKKCLFLSPHCSKREIFANHTAAMYFKNNSNEWRGNWNFPNVLNASVVDGTSTTGTGPDGNSTGCGGKSLLGIGLCIMICESCFNKPSWISVFNAGIWTTISFRATVKPGLKKHF